jgi:hypothetical protein
MMVSSYCSKNKKPLLRTGRGRITVKALFHKPEINPERWIYI